MVFDRIFIVLTVRIRFDRLFTGVELRLRNDLYCVEWGVKLYSLTHSLTGVERF